MGDASQGRGKKTARQQALSRGVANTELSLEF